MADPYRRVARLPAQSFFLLGPRGTGKSNWIRQVLPETRRIDLLDEARFQEILPVAEFLAELSGGTLWP